LYATSTRYSDRPDGSLAPADSGVVTAAAAVNVTSAPTDTDLRSHLGLRSTSGHPDPALLACLRDILTSPPEGRDHSGPHRVR
jgi:hypothetical protein